MQSAYLLPIKPLDGIDGYRRWKESILLRLRTIGIAHVLFDDPPPKDDTAASKKWDEDDALCRGNILHTLSDRLFDIHAHRSTAKNVWIALQRAYEDDHSTRAWAPRLGEFVFVDDEPILEQVAKFEAAAAAKGIEGDKFIARLVSGKLPVGYSRYVMAMKEETMEELCRVLRAAEATMKAMEREGWEEGESGAEVQTEEVKGKRGRCYNCGEPGHIARYCRVNKAETGVFLRQRNGVLVGLRHFASSRCFLFKGFLFFEGSNACKHILVIMK